MERDIAILLADLSGYTALTETHGSHSAADIIDRYLQLVQNCLVGDSQLHSVTGDEVMVVSSSADSLLATSLLLLQNASMEDRFLQVHGGLHFGAILMRNNNYFGTTINLASRITNVAHPGSFWCSESFIKALSRPSEASFDLKGKYRLKNISDEIELFELKTARQKVMYIDPVCRMLLNQDHKIIPHPQIEGLYFCSQECLEIFIRSHKGN